MGVWDTVSVSLIPLNIKYYFWFTRPVCYVTSQRYMTDFLFIENKLIIVLLLRSALFTFSFISGRKHLLATLLSLEGLMLIMFSFATSVVRIYWGCQSYLLIFLCLVACEGALGLSLLVIRVRIWGSDQISSVNSLQC